jgi:hypothetical protein
MQQFFFRFENLASTNTFRLSNLSLLIYEVITKEHAAVLLQV